MDIAKLFLEYLTLFLSWPVIFGLLVVYVLKQHGQAVASILKRVTSVSVPGVVTFGTTTDYPPEPTAPSIPPATLPSQSPSERLDKDFSVFVWEAVAVNRVIVRLEINKLWSHLMNGLFPPTILTGSEAKTYLEKMRVMKDKYKIDERAIRDVEILEGLTKDTPRQDLMSGYTKSTFLKFYLAERSAATRLV